MKSCVTSLGVGQRWSAAAVFFLLAIPFLTAHAQNLIPELVNGGPLSVGRGQTAVITRADLLVTDPDSAADIGYQLVGPPSVGTLLLDGVALTGGSGFTQSAVDAGRLSYAAPAVPPGLDDAFGFMSQHGHKFRSAPAARRFDAWFLGRARARNDYVAAAKMLALAMVLLHDPEVLAIDELSLGLAPLLVQELLGVVERLKAEGMTIIIVEQSLNVALSIADRAVFLEKGQVRFSGPAAELAERDDLARAVFLGTEGG